MKTCFKCGLTKPREDFYRHPMMADGRLGKCKECAKRDVRANYAKRVEQYRQYDRYRFHNNPKRRADIYAATKRKMLREPIKTEARNMVSRAIRSGKLVKQPCEDCGAEKVEAHHDDYSKPLQVRWLCLEHHRKLHGAWVG